MKYLLFNDAREGMVYTPLRKQFYILNINLIFLFPFFLKLMVKISILLHFKRTRDKLQVEKYDF